MSISEDCFEKDTWNGECLLVGIISKKTQGMVNV